MAENRKSRFWRLLGYAESVPENWRELVEDSLMPLCCILHDRDADKNGEVKKAHIHAVVQWGAPTTYAAASAFAASIGFVPAVKPAMNPPAAVQYLTHLNHPDKFQYDPADVEVFNGFDFDKYYFAKDSDEALSELLLLVRDFYNFAEFSDFIQDNRSDLFPAFRSSSALLDRYIRANRKRKPGGGFDD